MYDSDVISPVGQACCSYHRAVALPLYRVLTLGMGSGSRLAAQLRPNGLALQAAITGVVYSTFLRLKP